MSGNLLKQIRQAFLRGLIFDVVLTTFIMLFLVAGFYVLSQIFAIGLGAFYPGYIVFTPELTPPMIIAFGIIGLVLKWTISGVVMKLVSDKIK